MGRPRKVETFKIPGGIFAAPWIGLGAIVVWLALLRLFIYVLEVVQGIF